MEADYAKKEDLQRFWISMLDFFERFESARSGYVIPDMPVVPDEPPKESDDAL